VPNEPRRCDSAWALTKAIRSSGYPPVIGVSMDNERWGPLTFFVKAVALVLPWGVIEVAAGKHANLGYTVGIFVGILCMSLVPPKEKDLWRWIVIGVIASVVHPTVNVLWPKIFHR
jgi:hypothetical protein